MSKADRVVKRRTRERREQEEVLCNLMRCAKCRLASSRMADVVLALIVVLLAIGIPREAGCESAPRITIQPNDLIAIEGETTELNCDAEGQPRPTIEWFHDGRLIRTTHLRTIMGGSIQFLDVRPRDQQQQSQVKSGGPTSSDAGIYYCLARNSLGTAQSRNASLQVACKYIG